MAHDLLSFPHVTNRKRLGALSLLAAGGFALTALLPSRGDAKPQEGVLPEDPSATFGEQVSVGYVLVPVVVRDGARYVQNLDREDFSLLVDGKRVRFDSFERRADAPTSLVLLQDLSGSMGTGE